MKTVKGPLANYRLGTNCFNCHKVVDIHNASTGACPLGARDRTGGYTFHSNQFFLPVIPKLKDRELAKLLLEFETEARKQGMLDVQILRNGNGSDAEAESYSEHLNALYLLRYKLMQYLQPEKAPTGLRI